MAFLEIEFSCQEDWPCCPSQREKIGLRLSFGNISSSPSNSAKTIEAEAKGSSGGFGIWRLELIDDY